MNGPFLIALMVASSALTSAWHHWAFRHREVRHHREMCNHVWDEVVPVAFDVTGTVPAGHKRFCVACGSQKNTFHDGTEYVPLNQRIEGKQYPDER